MKKKLLALILALVMVLGMLPVSALATDGNAVTVGFTVVDCLTDGGKIEYMRKELTVTPGLAKQHLGGEYGGSVGMTTEVGENDVTPIDVLVAAHIDQYGAAFTDSPSSYIEGFDYAVKMFGVGSEITYTVNGLQPAINGIGYAINQYIVQEDDEIAFYRMSWFSDPANLYASFDKSEAEVKVGEDLCLKLGFCSTMGYVDAPIPAANAEIYALNADGTIGDKITETDENGSVTVSFDAAGTYYLTCKGEESFLADMDWDGVAAEEATGTLSPAYCKVTVTEAAAPELPTESYEIDATLGGSFKYPNPTYGYVDKITVTGPAGIKSHDIDRSTKVVSIYLEDTVPDDAEYEIAFSYIIQSFAASSTTWTYSGDLGDTGSGTVKLENGTKTVSVTTKTSYMGFINYSTDWKLEFKPYVAPTSVTLNKNELELDINYSETLSAAIAPEDSSVKSVTWTSSDDSIAAVNSSGKVTGKAAGTAVITATAGDRSASCTVTVKYVDVSGVTLNKSELELPLNNSEKLTAAIAPDNASDKSITWTSSNEEVATVDSNGNVTAKTIGEATITATACNGKSAVCTVTVSKTTPGLKDGVSAEIDAYLGVGETYEIKLTEQGIFVDLDGDELSYTVSVNGAEAVEANAVWYQYTPTAEGVHTLVFKCKDSDGNEAEDSYTVKLHALEFTRIGTYTDPNTKWNDNWNCGISYFEVAAEKAIEDPTDEVEAYVVLSSDTAKDAPVFVRVGILDTRNRFSGMYVNGRKVEGSFVRNEAKREWSGLVSLNWNDRNEAEAVFKGEPFQGDTYTYTLRFKLADANNTAPVLSNGGSKNDSVMQYSDYTVDVKSLFTDADDSWLLYSVDIGGGEFVPCGESYVFNSKTTGVQTLKFKAADLAGAESETFTLTLNVTDYVTPAGSFYIGDTTVDGAVLDVTILDQNGNPIEGVTVTVGEKAEEEENDFGYTYKVWRRIIDVTLPGNEGQVGTGDTVKAYFHLAQTGDWPWFTAGGKAAGHTDHRWDTQKTDTIKTTLKGGLGTGYGYMYETEPTPENNAHITYEIRYHIERDNNQAPQLKDGVTSPVEVVQEQYTSYTINAKDLLADPEGDKVTYYISVDGGEFEEFKADTYGSVTRTFELNEAGTTRISIKAKDVLGAESATVNVYLTVTPVHRYTIETGEGAGSFISGLNKISLYGVEGENHVLTKDGYVRDIIVQLKADVADDAEIEVKWEGFSDYGITMSVSNPVKLVDGKAEFTIETHGHFFDGNHRYYNVIITNEPNTAPTLADGVESAAEENVLIGEAFELNLDTVFTDADGDELTYTVSVDGADAVAADGNYSYIPAELGTYTLVFRAADKWGSSEAAYTVTLTAKNSDVINTVTFKVPEGITPSFYASTGFDANDQDILGTELESEAGASADGWTTYTVSVPDNIRRVSFRGTAGETPWGGMSVAVKDYENNVITAPFVLRQLEGIINTKLANNVAPTAEQAVFKVKYGEGAYAISGGSFNDQHGNLGYRFLLLAADNSLIYTYYAEPLGDLTSTYAESQGDIKTVTSEVAAKATAVMKLANKSAFKITAPSEATVQFFQQRGNYNVTELQPYETVNNNDGTKTVTFNANGGMFRVSMEGKITKAGYCDGDSITVTWDDDDRGPDYRAEYDTTTNFGARGNDSTYVNVNYRNNLRLDVNETFQLRAYRLWQIINTDTANVMIEPDFRCNVISGSDVISVTPSAGCSGNAKNNWLDIKGLKAGTAVIEVSYDALDLISNGASDSGSILAANHFTFNAVDPARTALIVVQVGAEQSDVEFGIRNNAGNVWDAEHDTLCFTGDSAELKFTPTVTSGSISKVEISGDKGASWTELTAVEGEYTANIVHGSNIVRITKADGTVSHQIVRGYQLTIVVSEVEGKSDMDGIIEKGETVSLWLKGYHNPVGKMSGIYNMQGTTLYFTVNGQQISRTCSAYAFYGDCKISIAVPGTAQSGDTIVLADGYATTSGFGAGGGAHRGITGEVPPNLDADTVGGGYNIYDDIVITVGASTADDAVEVTGVALNVNTASVEEGRSITLTATVSPANATDKTVTWTSSNPAVATVSSSGRVTGVSAGTATITAAIGEYSDTCTVTVTETAGGNTPGGEPELDFGLAEDEIEGYVTVSFVDRGVRRSEELSEMDSEFRTQLGTIIPATRVPFKAYDTIASVTLRLLEAKGFYADYQGDEYSSFYLAAIGDFTHRGTYYSSFGEFDAGKDSGWMITWDNWFINKGASEFMVEDGDLVRWQYTCQLGKDIGEDWSESTTPSEPGGSDEPETGDEPAITVTVTIADKGSVVMARQEVAVTDIDKDGAYTVNDVLYAAHETAYKGGAEAGYGSAQGAYGLAITKLWGDDSAVCGYWLNNASCWSLTDVVKEGDYVVAFNYADASGWSDAYARFSQETYTAAVGAPVTLTLEKAGYDANWNTVFNPCAGADITLYNSTADYTVTDNGDGTYSVTFAKAGTYYVVASAADNSIVPAVTVVEVEPFNDVSGWAEEAILYVYEKGLMNGVGNGRFDPKGTLNRAALVTILYRLEGKPAVSSENPFTDIAEGQWYTEAVLWAAEKGIVEGYGNGKFGPKDDITRQQAVTILKRYSQYKGLNTAAEADLSVFEDAGKVSNWAVDAVKWAVSTGLMKGRSETVFAPTGNASRQEAATILMRYLENILK